MLKYCLIDNGLKTDNNIPTGIRQWATAFSGKIIKPDDISLKDSLKEFDLIHVKLSPLNYLLVENIRDSIGLNAQSKIILSLDDASEDCASIFTDHEALKKCCSLADFIFATNYLSVRFLEDLIQSRVYELYHPVDFLKVKPVSIFKKTITIVRSAENYSTFNNFLSEFIFRLHRLANRKILREYTVKVVQRPDEWDQDFYNELIQSEFICFPDEKNNYGEEILHLGASGCKIFGTNKSDVIRRCFSLAGAEKWSHLKGTLAWFLTNNDATQFFLEHASEKMEYYNLYNSKKRLLNILKQEKLIDSKECSVNPGDLKRINYYAEMNHIVGPKEVQLESDEFAVVCLEKNGQEYLPSFLKHYRKLGAKHFFFIDNDSDDETISILNQQPDVTVYQTSLKHRKYESEIRRVIVDEHCKGSWCMCVDIDELFDYPYSNKISTKNLIEYLKENNFTSLVAYMLDMFSVNSTMNGTYLEDIYTHYDISNVKKEDYFSAFNAFNNFNSISNTDVRLYYGGVRQAYVGKQAQSQFLLVKHPLFYVDHHIEPVSMPHFCNKAKVADISGILKHYKLTFSLKDKINNGVAQDDYSYMIKEQIDAYQHMTSATSTLIGSKNAHAYIGQEHLIANNFIHITDNYNSFVSQKSELA